jgi:3-isopropylmalate/(R)-2-methylmalate dehydratase small subunit
MQPFTRHCGIAAPLEGRNVDTDQIVPARFLKSDRSAGYGRFLFHDLRLDGDGAERPDFVLNKDPFRAATILVADENFGCGSSREGAVYALADGGIRAVIAPSFGDIFYNNCLKNGIVPVALEGEIVGALRARLAAEPGREICVDLDALSVGEPGGVVHPFAIDPFWRECLMKGVDEIELTLQYTDRIEAFETEYRREMPWTQV